MTTGRGEGGAADAPSAWIRAALQRGLAYLEAGRPEAAANECRRILEAAPDLTEAHFLVGLAALAAKDRRTAVAAFGSVTRLRPEHGAAWAQLARLFVQAGQPARAERALAQAVAHERGDPLVQDLIGMTHSLLGDQAGARTWYGKAVAGAPDQVGYRINLANALVFLGETRAAEAEIERVLALAPDNPQAHWLLSGIRRAQDRFHVETLVHLAARPAQSPQALAFIFYALGKELEDLEEWDRAFAAFARGAAWRRRTLDFDEAAEEATYSTLERTFTAEWLADDRAARPEQFAADPAPIFVVGQPRTGTTLVERIISAHSQVRSAGELQQFGLSVRRLLRYEGPRRFPAEMMEAAATLDGAALGRAYLTATARQRGDAPFFVDKLPSNFLYLPLILKALPRARVVHLVRDPMDACFASFKQLFADAYPHSYDQGEMARHFVRYHRLMASWRERFPGRIIDVRYEEVAADIEPQARKLIARLGLPWEDACLDFHRQEAPVATASAVQVREPVHTRSVGRWRRYERHLAPMQEIIEAAGIPIAAAGAFVAYR
jgi:cytochrome c-type biogenesis protein CcmH/NrfG